MDTKNYARLPLANAFNVRELGGYPCPHGKTTNYHAFLRSDDLSKLTKEEIDFLLAYGLTAVIDLRSSMEIESYPDPFADIPAVSYVVCPMMADNITDITKMMLKNPKEALSFFYVELLKQAADTIKTIFTLIAEQKGCVLFHCAVGKDRTGILAMLLLGLCGVNKADILANYMVTEVYLNQGISLEATKQNIPAELMYSKPEFMDYAINYIETTYGSIEKYLLSIGIADSVLVKVKEMLCS